MKFWYSTHPGMFPLGSIGGKNTFAKKRAKGRESLSNAKVVDVRSENGFEVFRIYRIKERFSHHSRWPCDTIILVSLIVDVQENLFLECGHLYTEQIKSDKALELGNFAFGFAAMFLYEPGSWYGWCDLFDDECAYQNGNRCEELVRHLASKIRKEQMQESKYFVDELKEGAAGWWGWENVESVDGLRWSDLGELPQIKRREEDTSSRDLHMTWFTYTPRMRSRILLTLQLFRLFTFVGTWKVDVQRWSAGCVDLLTRPVPRTRLIPNVWLLDLRRDSGSNPTLICGIVSTAVFHDFAYMDTFAALEFNGTVSGHLLKEERRAAHRLTLRARRPEILLISWYGNSNAPLWNSNKHKSTDHQASFLVVWTTGHAPMYLVGNGSAKVRGNKTNSNDITWLIACPSWFTVQEAALPYNDW